MEKKDQVAGVKYRVGTYSGFVNVDCYSTDNDEWIIWKAKKILTRKAGGSLPFGRVGKLSSVIKLLHITNKQVLKNI